MYEHLFKRITRGHLLHVDETKVSIKGKGGLVWVFANLEEVVYIYRSSREAALLHCLPETGAAKAKPLPDGLFPDQRTGSLVLLIEGAASNAHSFHNCVVVRDTDVNFDEGPLMV